MSDHVHSPGPWFVDRAVDGQAWTGSFGIGSADGGHVCHTTRNVRATSLADAHLIAAAPELLAACVEVEEFLDSHGTPEQTELLTMLRAAIAKAEGR